MKFQFNDENNVLVSLEKPKSVCGLKLIRKYKSLLVFTIDSVEAYNELRNIKNAVCYLDKFILLLPNTYTEQKLIWKNFYRLFGEDYEKYVDKERNIKCIKEMLQYIVMTKQMNNIFNILDYGCGSGLSLLSGYAGKIIGYEPVKIMKNQAKKRGMIVCDKYNIKHIPDNYFDAVFSCYVLHMGIEEQDIRRIVPKMKQDAIWIANFYKNINEDYVNNLFKKLGFVVNRVTIDDERHGHVYEFRKQ